MEKIYKYIILVWGCISLLCGCTKMEDDYSLEEITKNRGVMPYCLIEENISEKYASGKLGTKSLINQTTTVDTLVCNFLRADGNGNWLNAYIAEGTISTSSAGSPNYLRSVSLKPEQPYNDQQDIKMVGWYPKTCNIPTDATENYSYTQYNPTNYASAYTTITNGETEYSGVLFSGLDGSKDIMVSNLKSASLNKKFSTDNFFTFKHYMSAVRIYAKGEGSAQDVGMWGDITKVVILGQPTTCKIAFPVNENSYAEYVEWGNEGAKLPIITSPLFGENDRSPENITAEEYPITLGGSSVDHYLGYLLIKPNETLRVQIHTTAGVYDVNISAEKQNGDPLFNAGYIYDLHLNFKTDGTINSFLGIDGTEKYLDLTTGELYDDGSSGGTPSYNYKHANCFIVNATPAGTQADPMYDGFCFDATVVGNGEKGLMSIGAQTLYPTNVHIKPVSADVLWETSPRLVTQIELVMGYVRFKVAKDPEDNTKFKEGNAVIAVYDENRKVLWSWHIWITDAPQSVSYTENGTEIVILDRNLGATAAKWEGSGTSYGSVLETYGLYYQWGRKDPSMGPPEWNYSPINMITAPYYDYSSDVYNSAEVVRLASPALKDGVENPMYLIMPTSQTQTYYFNWLYEKIDFLWGYNASSGRTTKTIYDPCPYGYRVSGGELADLFTYASKSGTFTLSDYGQKVSVPTNSNNTSVKSDFYFPYSGYKGVDRGLNSLVCSWRYVGEKADYQSATVSTYADDEEYFMHRTRIYLSKNRTWTELNVGNYTGHQIVDHANRRTAAPVRCVKNVEINRITAFITPNKTTISNLQSSVGFTIHAESFGSQITSATLSIGYHMKNNPEVHLELPVETWTQNEIASESTNNEGFIWNPATYQFNFETFCNTNQINLSESTGEFRFILQVKNNSNVNKMSSTTITVSANNYISFDEWDNNNNVLVGQNISRTVRLYGDSEPKKVEMIINNDTGNPIVLPTQNLKEIGGDAYTENWYFTTDGYLSFSAKGTYSVKFRVTYDNAETGPTQISETKAFVVKGLEKVTTLESLMNNLGANYVIKNVQTGLYIYDGGTNINGKASADYLNYFTFKNPYNDGLRIVNVNTQNYAGFTTNGSNNTLSITNTYEGWATRFVFACTNEQFTIKASGQYYWCIRNNSETVTVQNNDNNDFAKWEIYRVVD